jgi:hypothetical protein
LSTHINPYIEGYEDSLLFTIAVSKNTYLENIGGAINISFKPGLDYTENSPIVIKARRNTKDLLLEHFYKAHLKDAAKIIEKKLKYDNALKNVMANYKSTQGIKIWDITEITDRIVQNLIIDLYDAHSSDLKLEVNDFPKYPLSKFSRDIAKEVGLI